MHNPSFIHNKCIEYVVECCYSLVWVDRIFVIVLVEYLKYPSDFCDSY
jgi:hypothetical protein